MKSLLELRFENEMKDMIGDIEGADFDKFKTEIREDICKHMINRKYENNTICITSTSFNYFVDCKNIGNYVKNIVIPEYSEIILDAYIVTPYEETPKVIIEYKM